MENAVDALKLAFAIFVFILALAVLFSLAGQARETARVLISETDRTQYYEVYNTDETVLDKNGNRIVSLEDIIPALYRYAEENYGVTIIDKDGNIVSRFDLDTEVACRNWLDAHMLNEDKQAIIDYIDTNIIDYVNGYTTNSANKIKKIENTDRMVDLFKKIYLQDADLEGIVRREYYCAWTPYPSYIAQRIDSDLSRNKCCI